MNKKKKKEFGNEGKNESRTGVNVKSLYKKLFIVS